jgi:hypothetical protein
MMLDSGFETPILFIIFNRPETEQIVFDAIKKIRPKRLFVVADGPREGKEGEREKCEAARKIIEQVDWECEVKKNYSDINLGCGKRPFSGISWFFDHVEEGIILEDDCVPEKSFFQFCEELLEKYRNNEKIMMISGDNFSLPCTLSQKESYYFSRIPHTWGWATWRRAWNLYDFEMRDLEPILKQSRANKIWNDKNYRTYLIDHFKGVKSGSIGGTWDYQWTFSIGKNNGLSIVPGHNLISNIGAANGTHVGSNVRFDPAANIPATPMEFPLIHPLIIEPNSVIDEREEKEITKHYLLKKWLRRIGLFDLSKKIYYWHLSN